MTNTYVNLVPILETYYTNYVYYDYYDSYDYILNNASILINEFRLSIKCTYIIMF